LDASGGEGGKLVILLSNFLAGFPDVAASNENAAFPPPLEALLEVFLDVNLAILKKGLLAEDMSSFNGSVGSVGR
jgi:hypothetical protein